MANQEHLAILKQGVDVWNKWRQEHVDIYLFGADLSGADLWGTNLSRANLNNANLSGANLSNADLSRAKLWGADLSNANLSNVNLSRTDLWGAVLTDTRIGWTSFGNIDLRNVKGLETVTHAGPSTIGIDTIIRSHGLIPEIFLRKAGIPPSIIEQIPALIGSLEPIQYYTCFISYSSNDQDFAERLYNDFQGKGVRCWYAPEDMKIGDRIRPRIEESIRFYDKLLLVLSEHSLTSTWVAYEVERALNKEPEGRPNVLFPIRVDKAILTCETDWAKDILKSRHIGDFEQWKDHDAYQIAFKRLLRDLKAQS